ncbi:hypothetical protein [Algoriphagus sp. NG3]|uniref:hypothetical protein n=1 Tax=Algoriphagus sp. NG3 TaxID=3097546 RepID=UPI002A8023CF|nr:hypothetical protein [Algoriphagus sp. NG3]WPR74868.1 hypothetical protein SLW71_19570 [Algoriphagus sp. NG3]
MKITLEIKDSKASAFLNFIKSLDFIKIKSEEDLEEPNKEEILQNIAKAVEEAKEHEVGNISLRTANDFLDEL